MRIAQVSPLFESVPPRSYGGTERVVSYLTEELVRQGHEVTLFASGDSATRAELIPCCPRALRLSGSQQPIAHHVLQIERVLREAPRFDRIHFHVDLLHFPVARRLRVPHVTTLHGRLDMPDLIPLYDEFRETPLVSISDDQRRPLPRAGWRGTVHHGLPGDLYRPGDGSGGYLAFLGRISPEKGIDRAIAIAEKAGVLLKIAAKVDPADRDYYETRIRPMLRSRWVEYIGEIGEEEKQEFLGNARALLFPIDWPEPFGLVMIEAMACGTPVIARRRGSVPEILEEGRTGFLVEDEAGAVKAVENLSWIDRRRCREEFERRFLASRMARDYLRIYESLRPVDEAALSTAS
ncbi:MAG: glycosyltransferase family 4 protein [Candidatus Eisenbacteria bacterium]